MVSSLQVEGHHMRRGTAKVPGGPACLCQNPGTNLASESHMCVARTSADAEPRGCHGVNADVPGRRPGESSLRHRRGSLRVLRVGGWRLATKVVPQGRASLKSEELRGLLWSGGGRGWRKKEKTKGALCHGSADRQRRKNGEVRRMQRMQTEARCITCVNFAHG